MIKRNTEMKGQNCKGQKSHENARNKITGGDSYTMPTPHSGIWAKGKEINTTIHTSEENYNRAFRTLKLLVKNNDRRF